MLSFDNLFVSWANVVRAIDPYLRLPLIFLFDITMSSRKFNGIFYVIWALSVFTVYVALFLFLDSKNVCFTYGCGIILWTCLFLVRNFVPVIGSLLLGLDNTNILFDTIGFYLILIAPDISKSNNAFPKTFFLAIALAMWLMLGFGHYKFTWLFGYLLYFIGEYLGIHTIIEKTFIMVTTLTKVFGPVYVFTLYYELRRLRTVLRLFWLLTVLQMLYRLRKTLDFQLVFLCAAASCNSKIRLIAMSLWAPEVSYAILWLARAFLSWSSNHSALDLEPRDLSKPFIFCAIALMNNVTNIEIMNRVFFISVLMFISFSEILASVSALIDGVLKALSTSMLSKRAAHGRALTLMLALVWVLVYTSYKFCTLFPFHVWQLVVVSSNIVTAVKCLASLAIYVLFMCESRATTVINIESIDEWVYRITALANTCEFLSAFLIMGFGIWNVMNGIWNVLSLLIIAVHGYYNLWLKAMEGWEVFLQRRTAVTKLSQLADATREQLDEQNDVCPICFHAMETAKVTQCGHFFHANCLRKWLYIQTTCPLCTQDVVMTKED